MAEAPPPRTYQLIEKYDCMMERGFEESTALLMEDEEEWALIPPAAKTERLQTHMFQIAVRGAARN